MGGSSAQVHPAQVPSLLQETSCANTSAAVTKGEGVTPPTLEPASPKPKASTSTSGGPRPADAEQGQNGNKKPSASTWFVALQISAVVVLLLLAQSFFHFWLVQYVAWNVDSPSNGYASILISFKESASCDDIGSYFAQTVDSISLLGGDADSWESGLDFGNSLSEKAFHYLTNENETKSFVAVEVGLAHWLPNFFIRTVSLNVLARIESQVALHIENPVQASSSCPYAWNASSRAMNAALVHYLLRTANQPEVKLFSAHKTLSDEAELSGQWWRSGKSWVCSSPSAAMTPPDKICNGTLDSDLIQPTYFVFLTLWIVFILVSISWFLVFVRALILGERKREKQQASKTQHGKKERKTSNSNKTVLGTRGFGLPNHLQGGGAPVVPETDGVIPGPGPTPTTGGGSKEDEDAQAAAAAARLDDMVANDTEFTMELLETMLLVDSDFENPKFGPMAAAKRYCVLILPILLPIFWSIDLACDMDELYCERKSMIQLPIFGIVTAYSLLVAVFFIGSVWKIYPGHRLQHGVRGVIIAFSLVSVAMVCTHLLWLVVALTVDPKTAASRIAGLLSIFIYARQTWSKISKFYTKLVQRLREAGHEGKELEEQLEKRGFSKRQLTSLLWISTAALILLFVWFILCGVIFYANVPGTPGSTLLSLLTGVVIPVVAATMHVVNSLKLRSESQDDTPLKDLVSDAAENTETSNLSSALERAANTLKKLSDQLNS